MTLSIVFEGEKYALESGTTLVQFLAQQGRAKDRRNLGFKFGNTKVPLDHAFQVDGELHPLTLHESEGIRIYKNTCIFLTIAVFKKLLPSLEVIINHTISGGVYCTLTSGQVSVDDLQLVRDEIARLIQADLPFEAVEMPISQAISYFEQIGWKDTVDHLGSLDGGSVVLHRVDGQLGYVVGSLAPSTGYLKAIELINYASGFIIRYPRESDGERVPRFVEQPKLFAVFREYERWQSILDLRTVSDLNQHIVSDQVNGIIHVAESLHEKKLAKIADDICARQDEVRVVLIAGPSSSGKTTFSKRLAVHLRVNGIQTQPISLDDYFRDRVFTPRDEKGDYDFESIHALDLDLFNDQLCKLLAGKTVEVPRYDFKSGRSTTSGQRIRVAPGTILIIEGIHGLNDDLTPSVYELLKYKVYVSAFTPIGIDNTNRLPTTDLRLLRRIVRDNAYRGYSAQQTILRWPSVRSGEKKWVFPHQNKANILFNSTLIYEPAVLRSSALPLLVRIGEDSPIYEEALRLREFLSLFHPMESGAVPGTSLLREFIGGSQFRY